MIHVCRFLLGIFCIALGIGSAAAFEHRINEGLADPSILLWAVFTAIALGGLLILFAAAIKLKEERSQVLLLNHNNYARTKGSTNQNFL